MICKHILLIMFLNILLHTDVSKYCYVLLPNQLNISHLFTQLNDQTVLFQTISFSIFDPIRCNHSRSKWTWKLWQWRGTLHSPKLQHYRSLTIRLFSVISRTLIGQGVLPLCKDAVSIFYSPSSLGWGE